MAKAEDNKSVKSEITVKFIGDRFIPTDTESKASLQELKAPEIIWQINKRLVTSDDKELVNYYYENDYMWSNKESMSNFTWNTFNFIDDSSIEQWESESVSKNLLLDITDEEEENTIPFPTDLNDLPWWLDLLEKLSEHYCREFNNFSNTYFCNSIW
ncbi:3247_t:CDS:2 [Dentiscutata erythropus]|uniref:3247_t:CDS:1 n=1 Tax=Dentiscutata erythropus TaxID=1348616 RepID=A0A9N9E225_9GLOM|nr:3247_t:CDS:2 [Dentiscutata erythropus]